MTLISVYYGYNYELWGVLQRPKSENTFKNQVKHGQLQKVLFIFFSFFWDSKKKNQGPETRI